MLLSDFHFDLPQRCIATHPKEPRDSAKLMVIDRENDEVKHSHFYDLPSFLKSGDFLVFNNSRVIPARLFGKVLGKDVEILLVKRVKEEWQTMAKPGKRVRKGALIKFDSQLSAEVKDTSDGTFILQFNLRGDEFWQKIREVGEMPLPPYILKSRHEKHDEKVDEDDYQTVYADKPGSVAAPTAGLHFTEGLMQKIKDIGCDIGFVDLHVGLGTFEPIRTEKVEDHKIHFEHLELTHDLAERLNRAKKEGRRIVAVGTTTVRVLETCTENGLIKGKKGETDIYIYPGYKFKFVDGMITNFHLPKSSLLLLVGAFWSREKVLEAYEEAVKNDYRFYSYGDGMFIT